MSEAHTPYYAMVQINMKDPNDFMERYAQYVFPILDQFGVKMIAGSTSPITVEGDYKGNWSAILEFANKEAAFEWYNSKEYAPYKELRMNELTDFTSVVFVEGR
jgi:uncharacterized protein (DUF1330 family)